MYFTANYVSGTFFTTPSPPKSIFPISFISLQLMPVIVLSGTLTRKYLKI